jgi:phosphoglycolate phosphatase-like HAD superfamily hydrolase
MRKLFEAIVFDLDGTLVDTTALHIASSHHAARVVLGRDVAMASVRASLGRPLPESMAVVARGAGLTAAADLARTVPALVTAFLAHYAAHQD